MTAEATTMTPGAAMTLAAIAATGATPRPSGETLAAQKQRISTGVAQQLSDPALATQGAWEPAWLALSPDNANMAYVARSTSGSNEFAVVVRGSNANVADLLEDLDVGTVVPFTGGGSPQPVSISKGAMTAFTEILGMTSATPGRGESNLEQKLASLLVGAPRNATVYVIGHSLGGCLATVLALYLQARPWASLAPRFGVLTFAAPTAGLQDFADLFDKVDWCVNEGYVNLFDMVPLAWAGLDTAKDWYPTPYGPVAPFDVKEVLIPEIEALTGPLVYVQPNNAVPLNAGYSHDGNVVKSSVGDFLAQVGYQHANATYLEHLQAPALSTGPVVTSVSPAVGQEGMRITIDGNGFGADSVVDFGTVPCTNFSVGSGTRITATVPRGVGVVEVRVTGDLGTSPAVTSGQFVYGGPQPVVVTGITPDTGTLYTKVEITGTGFTDSPTVYFGHNAADSPEVVSSTLISVRAPSSGKALGKTVDVRVLSNGYLSPAGPADEFTYTD
ncbi:IPT/TIG domain-containing protein [Streptomyces sp. NBC_01077]|uniref:IPT/TIG domain-containing protein n=1 Tax=Streptomyces sp. NBC_01077 TaxID=2903746 RepID=UPI00386ABCD9|nr:IPT/TIG domain-containing protein [Streptomyces sp. NBC_01077]